MHRTLRRCLNVLPAILMFGSFVRYANWDNDMVNAAGEGNTARVRYYLDRHVSPDAFAFSGKSALEAAACNKHPDTVRLLVQRGADSDRLIRDAINRGEGDALSTLVQANDSLSGRQKADCLCVAVLTGQDDLVQVLTDQPGVSLNTRSTMGETLAISAARCGYLDVLKILVAHGAKLTLRDDAGKTALMSAVGREYPAGTLEVCRYLIRQGSDINAADLQGRTALMYAVQEGDDANSAVMVSFLLQNGADSRKRDQAGKTALYYAQQVQLPRTESLLLRATLAKHNTD